MDIVKWYLTVEVAALSIAGQTVANQINERNGLQAFDSARLGSGIRQR